MSLQRNYLVLLFGVYALACWLFFQPMINALHGHWVRPNDLDAGYLLLVVALYVFWQIGHTLTTPKAAQCEPKNHQSAQHGPPGSTWQTLAIIAFVGCLALAALTSITANKSVTLALLVAGFVPLCMSIWGLPVLGRVFHGCAILLMATPIWFVLVPALQGLTALAVNWLLQAGRWPVYVEDNLIALPFGTLEIAAGCAGLKFVQTALALTLIEGFLSRRSWRDMLVLGLAAAALAIVCNWLRVAAITLLALYLDISHPWVADHNWVGWVLFVLLLGPFFYWLGSIQLFKPAQDIAAQRPSKGSLGRVVLCLLLGLGGAWGLTRLAQGETSTTIGQAQLTAVRSLCESNDVVHPAPAVFPGAQLELDCAIGANRFLSLRGYLVETQGQEVINPVNEFVPGLPVLDFRITNARTSATAPGQYGNNRFSLAYGFHAARIWRASPEAFKLHSLARPFKPGPAWALVILGLPADTQLDQAFSDVSNALSDAAGNSEATGN